MGEDDAICFQYDAVDIDWHADGVIKIKSYEHTALNDSIRLQVMMPALF